jgi:NTE family protein
VWVLQTDLLRSIPLFKNLDNDDLDLIASYLIKENFPKGKFVFRAGEYGDTMYLVESGQVAVVGGDDGRETIAFMGPGAFVGEISLLLAQPRTANLQVMLDAQLWALRKEDFDRLVTSRPTIALEMMREISKRLVSTTQRKKRLIKPRRITAVLGDKGVELAQAISGQLKSPVALLPLPQTNLSATTELSEDVLVLDGSALTEETLAENLSHQIEVFKHVVMLMPNQADALFHKAIGLADTVVSVGLLPSWWSPPKKCDLWQITDADIDLPRTARRLVNRTVGLALSSGGSRGLAHIGVLKVLLEENIPIDMVAGTSAGALFGSLYVLGWDGERLGSFTNELKSATKITNWDFNFPPKTALVKGKIARDKIIARWVENKNFEDLATPFFVVAADVYTGEEIVFDSGPLADAIRSSVSIPVLVEPWRHGEHFLIDGGIVNPLPASVLQDRGADIIIGSSVVQPMAKSFRGDREKMPNMWQVVSNMFSAMEAEVISKQLPKVDVLIQHDVAANHALDFDQASVLVDIGEEAARQMLPAIKEAIEAPVEF